MGDAAILEKYGIDVKHVLKNRRGYRVWGPAMREQIVKLTHRFATAEVARDFKLSPTLLAKWVKTVEGVGLRERTWRESEDGGVVIEGADAPNDVVGFPTRKAEKRTWTRRPASTIAFQAKDIPSAIAILERLRGQSGKVNISFE